MSCCAGLPLARRFYHAGRSDDLRMVLEEVHRWCPTSPLLLAGVSLGGNVSLKLTGEAAGRAVPGLARVAVIAPPIDLICCAALLSHRRNRIYESRFLSELIVDAHRLGLDLGGAELLRRYERWRRFDSLTLTAVTDGLNRLFSTEAAPLRLARDLGLAAVNRAPGLKRFFMRHAMGVTGDLPRLVKGESL